VSAGKGVNLKQDNRGLRFSYYSLYTVWRRSRAASCRGYLMEADVGNKVADLLVNDQNADSSRAGWATHELCVLTSGYHTHPAP
jgi:hypothetical protein